MIQTVPCHLPWLALACPKNGVLVESATNLKRGRAGLDKICDFSSFFMRSHPSPPVEIAVPFSIYWTHALIVVQHAMLTGQPSDSAV